MLWDWGFFLFFFCDWGEIRFSGLSTSPATLYLLSPSLQDHNSSLTSQFLHAGCRVSLPPFRYSFLTFPASPLSFFSLISLPSFYSLKPLFSLTYLSSTHLILCVSFPCPPFTLSFPVTLCFCWGCLLSFISPPSLSLSLSLSLSQNLILTQMVWTVSLTYRYSLSTKSGIAVNRKTPPSFPLLRPTCECDNLLPKCGANKEVGGWTAWWKVKRIFFSFLFFLFGGIHRWQSTDSHSLATSRSIRWLTLSINSTLQPV